VPDTERIETGDMAAVVAGFARELRVTGVDASPARVRTFVQALDHLDPGRRRDLYWAGRITLCARKEDTANYDAVFDAVFGGVRHPPRIAREVSRVYRSTSASDEAAGGEDGDDAAHAVAEASRIEILRHRDLADLSPADRAAMSRLLAVLLLRGDARRSRRPAAAASGDLDRRRIVRDVLRAGGEPVRPTRQAPRERPRRVVALVDVSGSMLPYADAMLRFAHVASRSRGGSQVEVFTMGTRLTRVTREIAARDPDAALAAAMGAVPDWAGGTRLGDLLKEFLDEREHPSSVRGAVVLVLSDGWERGDTSLLGEQMARLHRRAHRVVWANPRAGRPGYEPVTAGMAAALPYVDDFVAGHNVAALEHLAAVLAGIDVRSGTRRRLSEASYA
jgi:uncharacterized protein with von Willebrand factor type A (vWA) domain